MAAGYRPPRELTDVEIAGTFQQLRADQRKLISKLSELEGDKTEHRLVVETLKKAPPERRCFRMMGGVLIERTVQEILPALAQNLEQLEKITERLKVQVEEKGREVNAYKEKYNIRFKGEMDRKGGGGDKNSGQSSDKKEGQGILVS